MTGTHVSGRGALYELTLWPEEAATKSGAILLAVGPPRAKGRLEVVLNASGATVAIRQGGLDLGVHDIAGSGIPEGGIVAASWNMLRLLVEPGRARVWLNPQFSDVTGASAPPADEANPPVPMVSDVARPSHAVQAHLLTSGACGGDGTQPPRLDVSVIAGAGAASLLSLEGAWRVDYVAILPPQLYSM